MDNKLCKECKHRSNAGYFCERPSLDLVFGKEHLVNSSERKPISFFEKLFGTKRCTDKGIYWEKK